MWAQNCKLHKLQNGKCYIICYVNCDVHYFPYVLSQHTPWFKEATNWSKVLCSWNYLHGIVPPKRRFKVSQLEGSTREVIHCPNKVGIVLQSFPTFYGSRWFFYMKDFLQILKTAKTLASISFRCILWYNFRIKVFAIWYLSSMPYT